MNKKEIDHNLKLTINIVKNELKFLKKNYNKKKFSLIKEKNINEFKSRIDKLIEKRILKELKKTKFKIVTEENKKSWKFINSKDLVWIIDPLDGTVNYVRGIGSATISIALFNKNMPIFGVLGEFPKMKLSYGGSNIQSKYSGKNIKVSKNIKTASSVICSGFPARYKFTNNNIFKTFKTLKKFGKVRMLGSASISLLNLAMGNVDAYKEENIMIWDVAAGLAILLGAGGKYVISKGNYKNSINVFAYNSNLHIK